MIQFLIIFIIIPFSFQLSTGVFDAGTASLVLDQLMYDRYQDDGTVPAGYKFKVIF